MKIKLYLSSLALVLFALLGGGSFSGEEIGIFFTILLVVVGITICIGWVFLCGFTRCATSFPLRNRSDYYNFGFARSV